MVNQEQCPIHLNIIQNVSASEGSGLDQIHVCPIQSLWWPPRTSRRHCADNTLCVFSHDRYADGAARVSPNDAIRISYPMSEQVKARSVIRGKDKARGWKNETQNTVITKTTANKRRRDLDEDAVSG